MSEENTEVTEEVTGDHPRKSQASHTELDDLLAKGEDLTEEMLDAIEQRSSVEDIRYLLAFLRRELGLNFSWGEPKEPAPEEELTSEEEPAEDESAEEASSEEE